MRELAGVLAAALLCSSCVESSDQGMAASSSTLPPAVVAQLAPDTARELSLGDGVGYHYLWSAQGPWAIHLVEAEMTRCDLDIVVVPAPSLGEAQGRARAPVADMTPGAPVEALVGVNGDFFRLDNGDPLGSEVTETTRRFRSRPALAWGPRRIPWIGMPVRIGDHMAFGLDTLPLAGEPSSEVQIIGGDPELLDGGVVADDLGVADRPLFVAGRHPRTAIGFDADDGLLWFVVVDGRQVPYSAGMSLQELVSLFRWLGVEEALNLDGGGSSTMLLGADLVNRPSDDTGERPVGNSLWLVRDLEGCETAP